jgi:hypothetical protein
MHRGQDPLKSHDAMEELRRQAHFGLKDVDEPLLAEAGLTSQLTRPGSASSLSKPIQPLDAAQVQELLEQRWTPAGVTLPDEPLIPEVIASLIRMTGGNFRLLTRLLTQIERVLSVNDLHLVSNAVVEAARDSLVIGPG